MSFFLPFFLREEREREKIATFFLTYLYRIYGDERKISDSRKKPTTKTTTTHTHTHTK